jgi:anti-sigma B factor antagonist
MESPVRSVGPERATGRVRRGRVAVTDIWIDRSVEGQSVVLRVGGDLDLHSAEELDTQLAAAQTLVAPPASVVLDLTAVTFLGSPILAVLARHHERCLANGSRLSIRPGGEVVRRPLTLTGLDKVLVLLPPARP